LVAEEDNIIQASLMVTTEWSDWRNGLFWWIQSVYVQPEFRRMGLYSKLYQKVKSLADDESNVCGFRLYVEHENVTAQNTYHALGMEETDYKMFEEMKSGVKYISD
jgi:ribosomal protein S18 acetylase RimI-like enzyme